MKKSISLRMKLISAFIAVSLVSILLVTVLSVSNATSMLTNKVGVLITAINDQFGLSVDNYFKDFEEKAAMVFSSPDIYNYDPATNTLNEFDTIQFTSGIRSQLDSFGIMISYNDFCLVYGDNSVIGTLSTTTSQSVGSDALYSTLSSFITRESTADGWKTGFLDDYTKIYYVKRVNNNAVLLISLYTTELNTILQYSDELEGMEVSLVDGETVIFSTNTELVGQALNSTVLTQMGDRERYTMVDSDAVVAACECLDGWKIVSSIPRSTVLAEINQMVMFNILIAVICVIISAVLGILISKYVCGPIHNILKSMRSAANGDFTVAVPKMRGNDEIAQLNAHYQEMLGRMSDLIRNVQNVLFKVADSSSLVSNIASTNQEVSKQVTIAIDDIANNISHQSSDSRKSLEQLENLAESINQTLDYVSDVSKSMDVAIDISSRSIAKVDELSKTTDSSTTAINNASKNFESLISEMQNIQSVAQSILNISSETGLLALNASIEAARAGEAGKGFAVVAGEISKLSIQTEDATNEINNIVAGIYAKIDGTVKAMNDSTDAMAEQYSLVQDVNQAFAEITSATEQVKVSVSQISDRASDMGRLKDVSLSSINNIVDVTESSSASAEEVMAITDEELSSTQELFARSEQLIDNVESLKEALAQFKILEEADK